MADQSGFKEASKFQIRETATLEKFEVEEGGRRLIETIRLVDGVIVSVERPPNASQGG